MKTGIFSLNSQDRDLLLAHFKRLPAEDRRLRFGVTLSDEALRNLVGRMEMEFLKGYFVGGTLVAVSFLVPDSPGSVEFAVSVDAKYRGLGMASTLLQHSIDTAAYAAMRHVVIRHASDNYPMAKLAARFSTKRSHFGGEVEALLELSDYRKEERRALELLCAAEAA